MILNEKISIKNLLEKLETKHERIAFLVNDREILTGSVSQGDIIRALIDGVSLKVASIEIANLNVITIEDSNNAGNEALELIINEELHAVPIVDKNRKIKSIVNSKKILKETK